MISPTGSPKASVDGLLGVLRHRHPEDRAIFDELESAREEELDTAYFLGLEDGWYDVQPERSESSWYENASDVLAFASVLLDALMITSPADALDYLQNPSQWTSQFAAWEVHGRPRIDSPTEFSTWMIACD